MVWTEFQLKQHIKAAKLLSKIINEIIIYLKKNRDLTEYDLQQYIICRFKFYNLKTDKLRPIVAFRENTSLVHYFPKKKSKKLKPGALIMIDIWAKMDERIAPFADITWMMYYGKTVPRGIIDIFNLVIKARNEALNYIKENLKQNVIPLGKDIDAVARNLLNQYGQADRFLHGTGHSLGLARPHGRLVRINKHGETPIPINVGYTIEPGIYIKNKFGIRSEINFYINKKLVVTTSIQNKILRIF